MVYKLYRDKILNYSDEYIKNPALNQNIFNKRRLNRLMKISKYIEDSNLINNNFNVSSYCDFSNSCENVLVKKQYNFIGDVDVS